jgi:hypothetical protein
MLNRSTALIPLVFTLASLACAPAGAQVSIASPFGLSGRFMPFRPLGRVAPQSLGYQPRFWYFENNFQSVVPSNDAANSINSQMFSTPGNGQADPDEQAQAQQPPADRSKSDTAKAKQENPGKVGEGLITSKISDQEAVLAENAIPRTSDTIEAKLDSDGQVRIKWSGNAPYVSHVTMALLDKDRKVLKSQTFTKLPVDGRFPLTNKTAFYQVVVRYVNGTTTSVISPL